MKKYNYFSSESVCEGHPDKICDLIADTILDDALSHDKDSRIACEVCCSTGMVLVMGEFSTERYIDIPGIVRRVIKEIGYTRPELGFDHHAAVLNYINQQSEDIALGVGRGEGTADIADNTGAGDQGIMFGYACDETDELMPLPITLAHRLTRRLAEVRKSGVIPYLRPDGKAQVTVAYQGDKPVFVDSVLVSAQHDEGVEGETIRQDIIQNVILASIPKEYLREDTKFFVNPTGRFVKGGPHGDSGLTGRKIIVDTYGGMSPHGGGSFSGKDPTKVDRSASYYARYAAKNVVAAGLARRCQLQVAYAIGKAHPLSLCINTFGTGVVADSVLEEAVERVFDFRPYSIIQQLKLKNPIYATTTNYGHFGKKELEWEKTDRTDELKIQVEQLSKAPENSSCKNEKNATNSVKSGN